MASRRKVKPLPDLRQASYTYPEKPDSQGKHWKLPVESDLEQMARKHGFPNAAAAADRLSDIFLWWRGDVQSPKEPTGKERREFLSALVARARDLNEALTKLGSRELKGIYEAAKNLHGGSSLDLRKLERGIKLLEWAAVAARAGIKDSPAGRRIDIPLKELCAKLWRFYLKEMGPRAKKLTRAGDHYSGKFFDFAWDATRIVGIRNSNNALGKAIEVAQAKVKEKVAQAK